ncbi:MAG: hypothetical protein QNL62_04165 [Gammaproteobacteria bacterium]|nr:hypothetical protein [Gammaproteobacteria bacterium]
MDTWSKGKTRDVFVKGRSYSFAPRKTLRTPELSGTANTSVP